MSAQVNFQSAAFVNLAFVFLGAFFGSLACLLCGKIFHKKYRLSLCFLLLSAAIVFAALFVIREKTSSGAAFFSYLGESAFFCAAYFCAGFFCAASLRVFFPIAALLYVAWTLSFGLFLYKKLPLPQRYSITASESFVRDEESGAEWELLSAGEGAFVDFAVYELNKNFLLPLPHYWHALTGARSATQAQGLAPDVLSASCESDGASSVWARFFYSAAKSLLGKPSVRSVLVPKQQLYPAIFEIKINSSGGEFSAKIEKIM